MKFSKDLILKAHDYLTKQTGKEPDTETIKNFLMNISTLGGLFLKNASKIEKDI